MWLIAIKSKPMKIVNFISGKDLGGPKQSFVLYSEALSKLDHEVHSVVRKGATIKPLIEQLNLPLHEVSYSRITQLIAKKTITKTLKEKFDIIQPDLIFCHKQSDLELVRNAVGNNITIIGVIHWFSNKHIKLADELIAVSEKVKKFLIDNDYEKPIHVIPNMVKITSETTYRDLPEVPLIGAMGLFRRKKGFHTLIEALAILKQNGEPFKAIIAGKGQLKPYLHYLRWRFKLTNELTIRGWVSNAERDAFVDSIDIFVLPSRIETFGMVVIEAMARMKRVVATKCGGPEEILNHGKTGYLVNKQNPDALAAQFKEIVANPKPSNIVALNAQIHTLAHYSIEAVTNKISKVL